MVFTSLHFTSLHVLHFCYYDFNSWNININNKSIGKEFNTRAEWRDYMVLTFYSFKNKVNEPTPLIKPPGSIDGQGK